MKQRGPLLIILILPILICFLAYWCWYSPVTTIVVVRHAERLNDSDTTSISEEGIRRAEALAHSISSLEVRRVYVSEQSRTGQTAAAVTRSLQITATTIPARETKAYVDSIKAHRGEGSLIVGHSDTVPKIIGALGIANPPAIPSKQFDDLFVVTLFRFRATLTHLKYGNPTR